MNLGMIMYSELIDTFFVYIENLNRTFCENYLHEKNTRIIPCNCNNFQHDVSCIMLFNSTMMYVWQTTNLIAITKMVRRGVDKVNYSRNVRLICQFLSFYMPRTTTLYSEIPVGEL
ncbi:uncharacterized protein LOC122531992 [Frieseomelitta varia]|uniref:uncharacterized protein LOC122531992 n=1 Tax=Frieseomelitta varia TaxID=561572 RepID=UPI001CB6911D|nr:uncharacterized protein LOC122531992 [Frieseomelitta varia]